MYDKDNLMSIHPNPEFHVDSANQTIFRNASLQKIRTLRLFFVYGNIIFIIAMAYVALGKITFFISLLTFFLLFFLATVAVAFWPMPNIYCSQCKKSMQNKNVFAKGKLEPFLLCSECKLYLDLSDISEKQTAP